MADDIKKKPEGPVDEELQNVMGNLMTQATRVPGDAFQPFAVSKPKSPGTAVEHKQGGTGKGTRPPFPIVPNDRLEEFDAVKQTDQDTFGFEETGAFDKDLNELALKEVAEARGLTVEQLLKSEADRKTDIKLKAKESPVQIDPNVKAALEPQAEVDPDDQAMVDMEAQLAKMKQAKLNKILKSPAPPIDIPVPPKQNAADLNQKLQDSHKKSKKRKEIKHREDTKPGVPKEFHDNPVIERLRKKLSLEGIAPAKEKIEGIEFELRPPAASMNLWILEKLEAARQFGDGTPMALAIKVATVSAAICKIEGEDVKVLLGILVDGDADELQANVIAAQTLWEMFIGLPSRKDLFSFHPELAIKLYEVYLAKYGTRELHTTLQDGIHRYTCPVKECMEIYDMTEPSSGMPPFCKIHALPMDDKGLIREIRSVPLA